MLLQVLLFFINLLTLLKRLLCLHGNLHEISRQVEIETLLELDKVEYLAPCMI
jgi:hypothetical protein